MDMAHTNMSGNIGRTEDTKPDKKVHANSLAIGQYLIIAILCGLVCVTEIRRNVYMS